MLRNRVFAASLLVTLLLAGGLAMAAGPSFEPAIWGDGRPWSTRGLANLPAPNEHNDAKSPGRRS